MEALERPPINRANMMPKVRQWQFATRNTDRHADSNYLTEISVRHWLRAIRDITQTPHLRRMKQFKRESRFVTMLGIPTALPTIPLAVFQSEFSSLSFFGSGVP
jgi:hypothetical protein